jgi:hypothetical protein
LTKALPAELSIVTVIEPPPTYSSWAVSALPVIKQLLLVAQWSEKKLKKYTSLQATLDNGLKPPVYGSILSSSTEMKLTASSNAQKNIGQICLSWECESAHCWGTQQQILPNGPRAL